MHTNVSLVLVSDYAKRVLSLMYLFARSRYRNTGLETHSFAQYFTSSLLPKTSCPETTLPQQQRQPCASKSVGYGKIHCGQPMRPCNPSNQSSHARFPDTELIITMRPSANYQ
jgi:hypothetical protein